MQLHYWPPTSCPPRPSPPLPHQPLAVVPSLPTKLWSAVPGLPTLWGQMAYCRSVLLCGTLDVPKDYIYASGTSTPSMDQGNVDVAVGQPITLTLPGGLKPAIPEVKERNIWLLGQLPDVPRTCSTNPVPSEHLEVELVPLCLALTAPLLLRTKDALKRF
jgi:hypothetical protein